MIRFTKTRRHLRNYLLTSLALTFPFLSYASNNEDDLFSLTLDELQDISISLATRTEETKTTIPSSITTFNQAQLKRFSFTNVLDILNYVPGFQITRGDWVGAVPKEHSRGVNLDNGYVLILLNGQRLNETSFGKASVYSPFIPISIVEKVEIIRGPGSALYGSNAFLGVVSITTKTQQNNIQISYGKNNYQQISVSASKNITDALTGYTNINFEKEQGSKFDGPFARTVNDPYRNQYIELGLQHANYRLSARHNQNMLDEFLNLAGFAQDNRHQSETNNLFLKATLYQNKSHTLDSELSYSQFKIASAGMVLAKEVGVTANDFLVGPNWRTQSTDIRLDHQWIYSSSLVLNSGVEHRHASQYQAGTSTTHYDYNAQLIIPADANYLGKVTNLANIPEFADLKEAHDFSAMYSQLKWQQSNDITLFIGARYDSVKGIDTKLSPRFAAVWQASEANTFKLQYGESFRVPVNNELYSNDDVTIGNPNLTSEYVKTAELVWLSSSEFLSTEVVLFNNQLRDFINKVPLPQSNRFTFDNIVNEEITGLELSAQAQVSAQMNITANYSHLFNQPINQSYQHFANIMVSYSGALWQFHLNSIYRDSVNAELTDGERFKQSSVLLLDARYNYQITDHHHISISATNLTNEKYNAFDPRVPNGKVPARRQTFSVQYHYTF